MVDSWNPIGLHRGLLVFGVLTTETFDLDHQMERVFLAIAIVNENDEVRDIDARFRAVTVRDFKSEVMVLDVREDTRVSRRPDRTRPPSRYPG
jgi:hypothetical protein